MSVQESPFAAIDVLDHLHDAWRGSRFVTGAEHEGEYALNELVLTLPSLIAIAHSAAEVLRYGEHPDLQKGTQSVGKYIVSRTALDDLEAQLESLCQELSVRERP